MTFRYIGSKARLIDALVPHFELGGAAGGRFIDLFCGTGVVAEAAAKLGWSVLVNDSLASAVSMAAARLVSPTQAQFADFGGYGAAVGLLNCVPGVNGFMWREYSPASMVHLGIERRYFTEANAQKLDGIRGQIELWASEGRLSAEEKTLLIGDLLSAANRVANIAGTYGCFLAKWQAQASNEVRLVARDLMPGSRSVETSNLDAFEVQARPTDVLYLDPPYSKRQYASYYHILETLALNDEPVVEGVCGLRPWKHKASPFCYKARALKALTTLVASSRAREVLISYSDEGHIDLRELTGALNLIGTVELIPLSSVGRYRPNKTASANRAEVTEYLIKFRRAVAAAERLAA